MSILMLLIKGYRYFISPCIPSSCRFHPTCSDYALSALKTYGSGKGLWLTLCRIGRCHPWAEGGYDPIPFNKEKQ